MIKADKYLKDTIEIILKYGCKDSNPRPKWSDGTPAYTKYITQQFYKYDISKGEFPITTLRNTALKGAFYDIEAIYLKQTNIVEEMNKSVQSWWKDFVVKELDEVQLGSTYGHTIKRYDLMNKLLKDIEENPFSRRHKINLWQEQQSIDDPKALEPCAGMTMWSVREGFNVRHIDLSLFQRSQDVLPVFSINQIQYVMLGMMVCNHLTFKTGANHLIGKFSHFVQNSHIYDRHVDLAKEVLEIEPTGLQPKIELICEPKDFYEHKFEDFKFTSLEGIKSLKTKIEIAV